MNESNDGKLPVNNLRDNVRVLEYEGLYYVDIRHPDGQWFIEEYDIPKEELTIVLADYQK